MNQDETPEIPAPPTFPSESDLPFRELANSLPQLTWMADETGHIFWYNQRWYDFTGTNLEAMQGWGWREVHHPDHLDRVIARWSESLKAEQPWEDTFPLLGKNGEYGWFLSRATPVRDAAGRVVNWFGTNTDITREREIAAALEQSRARKAAILESALDCIIVIDHESRIVEWNPASEKTFGHAREAAVGQLLSELIIPPALRDAHLRGLEHYLGTGEGPILGQRIEVPALHADGRKLLVELAVTPIQGAEPPAFSAYLRDISARKRAEADLAAHARLASLSAEIGLALNQSDSLREILRLCAEALLHHLDAASARIWTLNEAENVLEIQADAGLNALHTGPHTRIPVGQFRIGLIAQARAPHLTNRALEDEVFADPAWVKREGLVAFAGYPLLVEGHLLGVMGMFARHPLSDDTLRSLSTVADALALGIKRKRAEAELERARAVAEAASRTKSLFLANMSHELRTPLNAILGYSEMLEEEARERHIDFAPDLEKINAAGKHLLSLINDILDLSKIEAGRMELWIESFDVGALIEEVATTTSPLFEKNSNRFRLELAPDLGQMRADATKVRQCLFNLLSNAAKFTKSGEISLKVTRETIASLDVVSLENETARDWLRFEVRDTGIGMSAEQILRLFQAFSQADASTTRQFGGTGLGLALTRRFCQLMGGDVTVSSAPGAGSTFTLKIPANVAETERESAVLAPLEAAPPRSELEIQPLSADAPAPGTAILVIDDDASQRELMSRFLTREGFAVQTAPGGEAGLRLARQLQPIAITLDVMMAGMDGWSVLGALKSDPKLCDVPVIMLTMLDDKKRGYALGAADYATKPVDRANLIRILRKYACPHPPCSVLLVEDDPVTRQMMRAMLEREGWEVSEAENGRQALERIDEKPPTLILLDLMMPEMDGFDFAATLRESEAHRSIPIVVLTAKNLTPAERLLLSGSVERVLQKSGQSREHLMQQVRDLVANLVVSGTPGCC